VNLKREAAAHESVHRSDENEYQATMPLYPDAEYASVASTPTTLVLDPSDPTVLKQNANRDAQWTQFPGSLTVPAAGCYSLQAIWPGGSWHLTFAAGLVPSLS